MEEPPLVIPAVDRRPMWTFSFSGGALGVLFFVLVGLQATLFFGGFAGTLIVQGLFGEHAMGTPLGQAGVVAGIVTTVMGTAAMFAVLGALAGWTVYEIKSAVGGKSSGSSE